jgi:hypothetical protein
MKKSPTPGRLFFAAAPPLLAALFLAALPCLANDAPGIPKQRENRFLFIVDTSSAMRGCSNSIVQGVVDLLASDMRGEFRQGDTIGLWTYNDTLHPEFPMQVWSKADKSAIMDDMAAFLRGRRCEKRAHLAKVMPPLNQVIKNSERITVILISDGTGSIQGTPFDKEINKLQKKYARELRSAHVPFVTVLAARDGAVFDYTINYPGVVAIPHTANPEMPAETNAPIAAAISNPATNAPAKPRPTRSIIMSNAANVVHAAAPAPATVAAPVAPPPAHPAPPLAVAPVSAPLPVAAVAPAPASRPANAATAPSAREIAPPQTQPAPPPLVARQNPEPAGATPPPHAPPVSVTAGNQQPPPVPPVARNTPVANISPSGGAQLALYVMAFSLLTIAVVLVVFLLRRSRRAPQSSLISQSIDRPR